MKKFLKKIEKIFEKNWKKVEKSWKHCQRHNGPRVLSLWLGSFFWLKPIWNNFSWKRLFKFWTQYPGSVVPLAMFSLHKLCHNTIVLHKYHLRWLWQIWGMTVISFNFEVWKNLQARWYAVVVWHYWPLIYWLHHRRWL